jgi:predicted permease
MGTLGQDFRQALRLLAKDPGFTAAVVLTLGLGIGANTAIFTLLDQVLLRELPVRAPQELVVLHAPGPNRGAIHQFSGFSAPLSYPMYADLRDGGGDVFAGVLARLPVDVNLTLRNESERVAGELVSGNYFAVLGVGAAPGRAFTPDDDRTRLGHPVAMLSHGFWTRRFAADPGVVGREITLNGHAFTVVGVAAAGFQGLEVGRVTDVFVPMQMKPWITPTWDGLDERRTLWLNAMARLKPGVSRAQAELAANVVYRRVLAAEIDAMSNVSAGFRERFLAKRLELLPGARGRSELRNRFSTRLVVLMAMVGLVLLIACANVANLLAARAAARRREIAVRLALGASRARLVRQLLVESLTLSLLGAAAGLLLAGWTADALLVALPPGTAGPGLSSSADGRVLGFTLLVSVVAALLFGLAPAVQASRAALVQTLRDEGGTLAGGSAHVRLRRALVVAEVALSLLLLVGAGLFARSLRNLRALDPGFDARALLSFVVQPALGGYDEPRLQALVTRLREELGALPGVRSASAADVAVLTGSDSSSTVRIDGYEPQEGENMNPAFNFVAPDYFATLGIPVLRGRALGAQDGPGASRVAVVNEAFTRRFFGGGEALGRRFRLAREQDGMPFEIVGVARDGKYASLRAEVPPLVYVPHAQLTDGTGQTTFYVRAAGAPEALVGAVRAAVRRLDPGLPVVDVASVEAVVDDSLFAERLTSLLSAAFGLLATLLAATGLYAVLSFSVARRTREIGVRMALGAERRAVLRLVLYDMLTLAGIGIALGLPAALALGKLVEAQLFGLTAADPSTLGAATALLLVVVLLAGYVPARHATRIDPVTALRFE